MQKQRITHAGKFDSLKKKIKTNSKGEVIEFLDEFGQAVKEGEEIKSDKKQKFTFEDIEYYDEAKEEKNDISGSTKEKKSDKHIHQLVKLFKKNKIIKNEATFTFVESIFHELPVDLVDNIYALYNDYEILKLKNK